MMFFRVRHVCVVAIVVAFAFPLDSAKAGFFDSLFAPQPFAPSPMPVYPGPMPSRWRPEPQVHRRKHKPVVHRRVIFVEKSGIEKTKHSRPHTAAGLMNDESLQEGDAVMTQRGIRIFIGAGDHHKLEDFVSLSEIQGLSRRQRNSFAAMEAHFDPDTRDVVTGRSAADPGITAGAMITDPRGRLIRYVGP